MLLRASARPVQQSQPSACHTGSGAFRCCLCKEGRTSKDLLVTYLPSVRHTWFELGVCTYKQLAVAAYWSGSAMLTASQDRHKLLMNDIHSVSAAMTAHSGL